MERNTIGKRQPGWLRALTLLVALYLPMTVSVAQEDPEYKLEVGAVAGAITYLGDFNGNLTKGMQPWGGVTAKLKPTPRMAIGLTIGYGQLKGSSDDVKTVFPIERVQFSTKAVDAGLRYEYNFWAYGTGREYRGAKRLTPFITVGLGATYFNGKENGFAANLPLGAGIKYKVGDRLNLAAEWRLHFGLTDKLDGVKDPYGIKSSGMFKNTDSYSVIQASVTYDLWAKCKTCHNDRD